MQSVNIDAMAGGHRGGSIGNDFGFIYKHHRNVVANGINPLADLAFEARTVGQQADGSLAH